MMKKKKPGEELPEVRANPPAQPVTDEDDGWGAIYRWAETEPFMVGLREKAAAYTRQAKAAGRYPRVVSEADIARFRADPAALNLPVIGQWQPRGYRWLNEHWVDLRATEPGARTEDDEALKMLTMTVAEFVDLMTPGHAYGIVQDQPNWESVAEFEPPPARQKPRAALRHGRRRRPAL